MVITVNHHIILKNIVNFFKGKGVAVLEKPWCWLKELVVLWNVEGTFVSNAPSHLQAEFTNN